MIPASDARDARTIDVRIRHRRGEGALARLLVGWLAARLDWTSAGVWPVTIDEHDGDDVMIVSLANGEITATLDAQRVLVECLGDAAPFSMAVPRESEAEAVAAELRNLTHDRDLRDALAALAARATSSESF
jgi:glucose-6-phosphate dehydrogenase assembly protein OpcA